MQLRARHDLFCLAGLLSICAAGALHLGAAPAGLPPAPRPVEIAAVPPAPAPVAQQPAVPSRQPRFLGRDPFARPVCPMDNPVTVGLVLHDLERQSAAHRPKG